MTNDLGEALRAWRDRLSPPAAGLPTSPRRRASGLRREEVADLTGVSSDYLVRLEQGRARHPSAQVVQALARALRLDDAERDQLYRLAGHLPPGPGRIERHVTPSILRLIDQLGDTPTCVLDASWQVVMQNPAADAYLGSVTGLTGRDRNRAWRSFHDVPGMNRLEPQTRSMVERDIVADLRMAQTRYPDDPDLTSLVDDLRATSERFAELWEVTGPRERGSQRKTLVHPVAGRMEVDCDVLTVRGSDLQIVVFSAEPGTPDADALALAVVVGLQELEPTSATRLEPSNRPAVGADEAST